VEKKLIGIAFLVNLILIFIFRLMADESSWYGGQLNEYYFLPSFPYLIIIIAYFLNCISQKHSYLKGAVYGLITLLIILNIRTLANSTHSDGYLLKEEQVKMIINQVENQAFSFSVESEDPCKAYGYRYLFTYYKNEPIKSDLDPIFGWLYQNRIPNLEVKKVVELKINRDSERKVILESVD
jgi:hypothetical protein